MGLCQGHSLNVLYIPSSTRIGECAVPIRLQSQSPYCGLLLTCHPLISWPNPSLLPTQLFEKATHHVLSDKAIAIPGMLYGPDAGDDRLRKSVASWLTSYYSAPEPILEDRIAVTGGASQNLACLLQVFTDPIYTRNVWLVSPSYMLVFRVFDDR